MAAALEVSERYVIPRSAHAGSISMFDIVKTGPIYDNPQWFAVGVSQRPTKLPQETKLGDVKPMVVSTFRRAYLFTHNAPKNEFWNLMRQGMTGPAVDLVIPGAGLLAKVAAEVAVDVAFEHDGPPDPNEYAKRAMSDYFSLPYFDIIEIDWREMHSIWSGQIRHLTIMYVDAQGKPATMTLVLSAKGSFKEFVHQLFSYRYVNEFFAEQSDVMDSLTPPGLLANAMKTFTAKSGDHLSIEEVSQMLDECSKARDEYLAAQGITEEKIKQLAIERTIALLQAYRGLPKIDDAMSWLASGSV